MSAPGTAGRSGTIALHSVFYGERLISGYIFGNNAAAANNTTAHMRLIRNPGTLTFDDLENPTIRFLGGAEVFAKYTGALVDLPNATLSIPYKDETFESHISSTAINVTTNTAYTETFENPGQVRFKAYGVVVNYVVTNPETGFPEFIALCYPNAQIVKVNRAAVGQRTGDETVTEDYTYSIRPSRSAKKVYGLDFSGTNDGVTSSHAHYIRSNYPMALTSWRSDGAATTFNLAYVPASTDNTGAAGNYIYRNGVLLPVTTVEANKTVTLAAAGAAAEIITVMYPAFEDYRT